jgi:hypothetical protein
MRNDAGHYGYDRNDGIHRLYERLIQFRFELGLELWVFGVRKPWQFDGIIQWDSMSSGVLAERLKRSKIS